MNGRARQSQPTQLANKIAEPDSALKSYLDTLLSEIDDLAVAPPKVEVKEPLADADIKHDEHPETTLAPTPQATIRREDTLPTMPDWVDEAFQVLLFEVNGIKLGIPLSSLVGILTFSGEASQLPGQPVWSMGVIVNRDEKVVVINSATLLMPERLDEDSSVEPQHLLLIGDGQRALAVDRICNTLLVDKEEVRWRTGSGIRPWYAGIIIQELSVLLDVDGILKMLAD
ncbi:chemotaxis protein CheW [Candidatus Thiodiazotropha sp. CDECU1]|uniref:chemotaxis protein CheW n=1 Tax=Candidatus Thiodiazotropha sp. CDECU1 TaxID=3065865 RepID=UPI0029305428|nr:chemotaxis protein CheW [Candidatus Thiodiazotropha sp. CDECU1]